MNIQNLFAGLPNDSAEEVFETLFEQPGLRLERIVSFGQATPPGKWVDQDQAEWVLLLRGKAGLQINGEPEVLEPGDYLLIPAHRQHRVEWTSKEEPTIWLALQHG
jgi:cupin 2 domain-containing protein